MVEYERYNSLLAQKLIVEFEKRGFEGYYCETKKDAVKKILELIPENALISYGGSATLIDIGIREVLNNEKYRVLDPNGVAGAMEMDLTLSFISPRSG